MLAKLDVVVDGFVSPGFEPVREAFERSFAEGKELGAAVSVYRGTEPLVDLWGGYSDMAATRPWERDTMVLVLSATKGIAGLAPLRPCVARTRTVS